MGYTGEHVDPDLERHVILDNLSAHKSQPVRDWLAHKKRRRLHLHFTPTSSSWLNLVECWFSVLSRKALTNTSPMADNFIGEQVTVGMEGLGERLLRASLEWWLADPVQEATAVALLTAATRSAEAARVLQEVTGPEGGIPRLLSALGVSQPRLRAALIGSTMLEVVLARLIVHLEPIASADLETLISWYGPVVQGYLTRPLTSGAGSGTGGDTGGA